MLDLMEASKDEEEQTLISSLRPVNGWLGEGPSVPRSEVWQEMICWLSHWDAVWVLVYHARLRVVWCGRIQGTMQ